MMDTLFDMSAHYTRRIHNDASARNAIGELAAEYACAVLGLRSLPVDGRKAVCPDAESTTGIVWEIKSVGQSRRALLYKWRVEKELKVLGRSYLYAFVLHKCPITVRAGAEIRDHFLLHRPPLLIATLGYLWDNVCAKQNPRSFRIHTGEQGKVLTDEDTEQPAPEKAKHGSQRKGYVDGGWQFGMQPLLEDVTFEGIVQVQWGGQEFETRLLDTTRGEFLML